MKIRLFICIILIISFAFSFASCEYLEMAKSLFNKDNSDEDIHYSGCDCYIQTEDGYTGGITREKHFHDKYEVYWLETYDEVLAAIELLKSHGSTIECTLGFSYDNELLDSKYCFIFEKSKAEPLAEGKKFFDRKIDGGKFDWYGFYGENITISEMMYYNTIDNFNCVYFTERFKTLTVPFVSEVVETIDDFSKIGIFRYKDGKYGTVDRFGTEYYLAYDETQFATIRDTCRSEGRRLFLAEEYQREFFDTLVIIE